MSDTLFFPERVYVAENCLDLPLTKRTLENCGPVPVEVVPDESRVLETFSSRKDPVGDGKRSLFITRRKGRFIKPCPCTPAHLGCGYWTMNVDANCPIDCSYCILQEYLGNPLVTVYANTSDLWEELEAFLGKVRRPMRIGTGELGDSLALDHLTGRSKELIPFFGGYPHVLVELKTKTVNIANVLDTPPQDNVVIAWSLNAETMAASEEKGAPAVIERIQAAYEVVKRGYRVAFHFDPLLLFPGWEKEYESQVACLMERICPDAIAWISLGSLRFSPGLKPVMRKRFPESRMVFGELVRGKDGKYRYFRPLRVLLYRKMLSWIRGKGREGIPVYLCMETDTVWKEVFGKKPRGKGKIERSLSLPLVKVNS